MLQAGSNDSKLDFSLTNSFTTDHKSFVEEVCWFSSTSHLRTDFLNNSFIEL